MNWLSARDIAGLPGFELSARRTRDKLTALKVPSRNKAGRGGGLEYDCAALPQATRQALMLLSSAQAVPAPGLAVMALAPASFAPPPAMPAPIAPVNTPEPQRKPPSHAEKQVADARMQLVDQLLLLAQSSGTTRASQVLALQLASGECSSALQAAAKLANQRARTSAVGERTLFNYLSDYRRGGWWALLPAPKAQAGEVDHDVACVLGKFMSTDAQFRNMSLAAIEVTKQLGRPYDTWRNLYDRARRALPKVDTIALIKARHTGAERAAKLPFKRRDTLMLKPLDVWLIDGHTFKAKVRHPEHGAPFAPEVTVVIDAATRLITGWSTSLSETTIAVGDALRHAVGNCGVPAILYSDNGGGETGKQIDCPVAGLLARLGVEHRTGIAGHPQGHGLIERSWRTTMINCARQFGSYQGQDADAGTFRKAALALASEQRAVKRAQATGEVIQLNTKCPSWRQFMDAVQEAVQNYNQQHRHRGLPKHETGTLAGQRMTPKEMWDATLDTDLQHKLTPQALNMLFMPALLRTAKRGEVQFLNQIYFNSALMAVDGQQVRVHYDLHDASAVQVFTTDGEFVCEALFNANKIDYFPKPVIEMAREKRVKGIVKRRQAQIDTALAELGTAHDAGLSTQFLSAPDSNSYLVPQLPADRVSSLHGRMPLELVAAAHPVQVAAAGRPFFENSSDRYEWLMAQPGQWQNGDANWISSYVASEDYAQLLDYYTARGLDWKDDNAGELKGAQ
jgi:putative transposase